jgi:uncharacterized protein (DUF2384 family)
VFGSKAELARYLGVDRSRPGRWESGEDVPAEDALRRIQDLDYVLSRAQRVWAEPVAREWLRSPNAMLNGATPLAVLKLEGPAAVIAALDAASAGSYA